MQRSGVCLVVFSFTCRLFVLNVFQIQWNAVLTAFRKKKGNEPLLAWLLKTAFLASDPSFYFKEVLAASDVLLAQLLHFCSTCNHDIREQLSMLHPCERRREETCTSRQVESRNQKIYCNARALATLQQWTNLGEVGHMHSHLNVEKLYNNVQMDG